MYRKERFHNAIFSTDLRRHNIALTIMLALLFLTFMSVLVAITAQPAQGQTFQVIHQFTGTPNGSCPYGDLTMDAAGNLYGVTENGYFCGDLLSGGGTVFKLSHSGSDWALTTLYSFNPSNVNGGHDGRGPQGGVTLASDGTLYGTTYWGGGTGCFGFGCGVIYHLTPPAPGPSALPYWDETVLYRFTGGSDGAYPWGDLTLDQVGNLYGVTGSGGTRGRCTPSGCGVVFKLTGQSETVVYAFQGFGDGFEPVGGVALDQRGKLYGVTTGYYYGQGSEGTVYELSPSGSDWAEHIIHAFAGNDGAAGEGGLILDSWDNLYGTNTFGGIGGGGTVFEISPTHVNWTFVTLYSFLGRLGPLGKLSMDAAGNCTARQPAMVLSKGVTFSSSAP